MTNFYVDKLKVGLDLASAQLKNEITMFELIARANKTNSGKVGIPLSLVIPLLRLYKGYLFYKKCDEVEKIAL